MSNNKKNAKKFRDNYKIEALEPRLMMDGNLSIKKAQAASKKSARKICS